MEPYEGEPDENAVKWAMYCHLGGLAILLMCLPFGNIIVPLILWLMKRDEHPFIDDQGKEALNFQLSLSLYVLVAGAAVVVLSLIGIGFLFSWMLALYPLIGIVGAIIGGTRANSGEPFRYPYILRFLS